MSRIGLAISVHDKIDELETGIRIVREHWSQKDVFISVCCNDPRSFERVKNAGADAVVLSTANFSDDRKTNIRSRQYDSIRKSVGANMAKYVMHYHADAYPVSDEAVVNILDEMDKKNLVIAFRGRGLNYSNPKAIYGDVDDHFLVFRRDVIEELDFFEAPFPAMLTKCNTEALLAHQMKKHLQSDEHWHYSDMSECEVENGRVDNETFYKDGILHRAMNPFNVDIGRKFVHAATKELAKEHLLRCNVPSKLLTLLNEQKTPKPESPDWLNEWMDG